MTDKDKETTYIRCKTGKAINVRTAVTKEEYQYPHKFFTDHPGEKPPLYVQLTTQNINDVAGVVKKGLKKHWLRVEHAKTFLYLYYKEIKGTLTADWSSYGTLIAKGGEEICPLDLVKTTVTDKTAGGEKESVNENEYPHLLYAVLAIYRLIRITNTDHRTTVLDRINAQIKGLPDWDGVAVDETVAVYMSWQGDKTYNRLVACFDMFMCKFPEHAFTTGRICTIGSRFKDCVGLTSLGYLLKSLSMKKGAELLPWIYVEEIGDDLDRMMEEKDEFDVIDSYFPYQIDMGLVVKSGYSSVMNPHFFFFAHSVGTLHLKERSKNAIFTLEANVHSVLLNATILAFVFSKNIQFATIYNPDGKYLKLMGDEDSKKKPETIEEEQAEQVIKSKNPAEWFIYMSASDFRLPSRLRLFFLQVISSLGVTREKTIGMYLQKDPLYAVSQS